MPRLRAKYVESYMMNHFFYKRFYFYRANGQDIVC